MKKFLSFLLVSLIFASSYAHVIKYYPLTATQKFGYVAVLPNTYQEGNPIPVIILLNGIGEVGDGSLAPLQKMAGFAGWGPKVNTPGSQSLYGAVDAFNFVVLMPQTTANGAYNLGEIPFIVDIAHNNYKCVGKPLVMGSSLGGYGMFRFINTKEKASLFSAAVFLMPGGSGTVGAAYPAAAVAAGLESYFYHAKDDSIAKVNQSSVAHDKIIALGGVSYFLEFVTGGHLIGARPTQALYPKSGWRAWNNTNQSVTARSWKPEESIYHRFLRDVTPIEVDKLIYILRLWQKKDGSYYKTDSVAPN